MGPQDPKDITRDTARDRSALVGELAALKGDAHHWLTESEYAALCQRLEISEKPLLHTRMNKTSSFLPPATVATRAPAPSPRYPPRRCGSLHSACSGSRWTTYLAGPLPLGRDLREPRGTLLWRLPAGLLLSYGGCSRSLLSSVSGTLGSSQ